MYKITTLFNTVVKLPKSQGPFKEKSKYSSQISKLQKEFGLKDTDGLKTTISNGGNNGLIKIHHQHSITKLKWD